MAEWGWLSLPCLNRVSSVSGVSVVRLVLKARAVPAPGSPSLKGTGRALSLTQSCRVTDLLTSAHRGPWFSPAFTGPERFLCCSKTPHCSDFSA